MVEQMSPPNSPAAPKPPRARLPTRPAVQKIEQAGGLTHVLDRIVGGETNRAIADSLGLDRGDFSAWLSAEGGELYREALRRSAEGLMDRGEDELRACDPSQGMATVQKAKLICEHYYRLAGIRNAAYRLNAPAVTIEATASPAAVPQFVLVVHGQDTGRTFDHE